MIKPDVTCVECGEEDDANYVDSTRALMLRDQRCFTCYFWLGHIESDRSNAVVASGTHYRIQPDSKTGFAVGFGGAEFRFRPIAGGDDIVSHNVWYQGEIPERFRDRLPDTHTLIRDRN
jgi:hypothetical protein